MRMQSSQANCGPTALFNAGCALGRKVSLEECEKVCRTSATKGTSPLQLGRGARSLGFTVENEIREARSDISAMFLRGLVMRGMVPIIAVDADSHWAAVVGVLGGRYLVADSAENELVLSYSEGELLQRWQNPGARKGFYALVLS